MTRQTLSKWVLMVGALALMVALQGCGGDDNGGLSAEDMARIDAAEAAAAMAQTEAEEAHEAADAATSDLAAAQAELAELQAQQAEMDDTDMEEEEDTSALDAAIAALQMQIAALTERTADPETPLAILGGEKSTMSAADRAALATKIAMQLNTTFDHDLKTNADGTRTPAPDESLVNLPELTGTGTADKDEKTRNIAHAIGHFIVSSDGTSEDYDFLKHKFAGGPTIDLTSPGDIETLSLTNLLKVNGVDLKSFRLKETDKVRKQTVVSATGDSLPVTDNAPVITAAAATVGHMRTTTLRKDGSRSVVHTDDAGNTTYSQTITYVGGSKVVEYDPVSGTTAFELGESGAGGDPAASIAAMVTRANGDTRTYTRTGREAGAGDTAIDLATAGNASRGADSAHMYVDGGWMAGEMLPAVDQARDKAAYNTANPEHYKIAQHNAKGYGAWLSDSFFVAYVMNAEDDAIISDPDDTVMKVAWGSRSPDNDAVFGRLSGRGETAMWKGLMVGHDMDADADTHGEMLKGNAMITARVGAATLADNQAENVPDIVDVMLSNIITADGTAVSRVADGIEWTNLDLDDGAFHKGSEISGRFFANGDEVAGEFNKHDILGVFGAMEYEAMDDMMDVASGN